MNLSVGNIPFPFMLLPGYSQNICKYAKQPLQANSLQWLAVTRFHALISLLTCRLLNDSSNTSRTNGSTTLTLFEYRISSYFLCFLVANFAENCCFCILYFNLFDFLAPFWHRIEIIYLS